MLSQIRIETAIKTVQDGYLVSLPAYPMKCFAPQTKWEGVFEEVRRETERAEQHLYGEPQSRVSDLRKLISQVINYPHITNHVDDTLSDALSESVAGAGVIAGIDRRRFGLKNQVKQSLFWFLQNSTRRNFSRPQPFGSKRRV